MSADPDDIVSLLKACRMRLSRELHMPPYIVCDDKTITDMAKKLPTSPSALLDVHGMGVNKVGKFGTAFLEVIKGYVAAHP